MLLDLHDHFCFVPSVLSVHEISTLIGHDTHAVELLIVAVVRVAVEPRAYWRREQILQVRGKGAVDRTVLVLWRTCLFHRRCVVRHHDHFFVGRFGCFNLRRKYGQFLKVNIA